MDEINNIGARIKEAREKKGMKQNALAAQVKIAPQTLSAYEKGSKIPTLDNLISIAVALDVSIDELVWPTRRVEINSVGNAARMIDSLYNAGFVIFGEVKHSYFEAFRGEYPEEVEINVPAVGFVSEKLSEFVKHYQKMRALLADKTIDEALFKQWIDARLSDLDKYYISPPASAFSELQDTDGELPF